MAHRTEFLKVAPLAGSFGAEVDGVDFSKPVPQDIVEHLITLMDKYAVLIFRKTALDNARHVAFATQLGKELEQNPSYAIAERLGTAYLFDVGNIEKDGSLVKKGSRRWEHALGNALWHTDSSYKAPRAKYSLLCCHSDPIPGVANTGFCDTRAAYAALPEDVKIALEGLIVEHDLWHSRKLASPVFYAEPSELERTERPPAWHNLVQTGPDGRKILYLAAHAKRILGMPAEDSTALLSMLTEHCTKPEFTFEAEWKYAGDMMWWDNRQSMHRSTLFDTESHRRDVRRATVVDDAPGCNGVSEADKLSADTGTKVLPLLSGQTISQRQFVTVRST